MKAVWLDRYGDCAADALRVDEAAAVPTPGHQQVLVKVLAASVNPLDTRVMGGYGHTVLGCSRDLPLILGRDFAGEVVAVGTGVWNYRVGSRVWGCVAPSRQGTFAEYTVASVNELSAMPAALSFEQAAAVPFAALTACQGLRPFLQREGGVEGARVFIHGGSGPLGRFAVQLLRVYGCEVAVSCSEKNAAAMLDLGCAFVVDYNTQYFSDVISEHWGGQLDFFLDNVGVRADPMLEEEALRLLPARGGFATTLGTLLTSTDEQGLLRGLLAGAGDLLMKKHRFRAQGVDYDWVLADPMDHRTSSLFQQISALVDEGKIKPHLHTEIFRGPEGVLQAMDLEKQRGATGKVVISMAGADVQA